MISNAEFVYRALRNIKARRAHQLRNITVKDGITAVENRGSGTSTASTIPYTSEELERLGSIESNLTALLQLFDRRAEDSALKGEPS